MDHLPALKCFYDNRLGVVELEDDVLSVVRQIREAYEGRVVVQLDPHSGWFHLVEKCEDHTERLIFSVKELDARVLERLARADSHSRGFVDPYEASERAQDDERASRDEQAMEGVRDAGERLAWALGDGKHGPGVHQSIRVTKDV